MVSFEQFFNHQYGIISPYWNERVLYPIYRALIGKELSEEEKKQIILYYNRKHKKLDKELVNAINVWNEARKATGKDNLDIKTFYKDYGYSSYASILPDAFLTAAKTLNDRSIIYNKEELDIWINGQDKVFSFGWHIKPLDERSARILFNKHSPSPFIIKNPDIKNELLSYDQDYQEAAANFYSENYDAAERLFKSITENIKHPWKDISAIILGRIYIRKAYYEYYNFREDKNKTRDEASAAGIKYLQIAKNYFNDILKDNSLKSIHENAQSLLDYVNFRIDPEKRYKDAAEALLSSNDPEIIINNLEDLFYLSISHKYSYSNKYYCEISTKKEITKDFILKEGNDLAQWFYIWKNHNKEDLESALKKYNDTKSLPWLIASLKIMQQEHPLKNDIINASLKIPKESPAYFTAAYYRLRLQILSGENNKQVEKELDDIFKMIASNNNYILENYFNDLVMMQSKDFKNCVKHSLKRLLATEYNDKFSPASSNDVFLMDGKVKKIFNELLPIDKWMDIVTDDDILPHDILKNLRAFALLRAFLLDDLNNVKKIANLLSLSDVSMKEELADLIKTDDNDGIRFAAVLFFLRHPQVNYVLDRQFDQILVDRISLKTRNRLRKNWLRPGKFVLSLNLKEQFKAAFSTVRYNKRSISKMISPSLIKDKKEYDNKRVLSEDEKIIKNILSLKTFKKGLSENDSIYLKVRPNLFSEIVLNYCAKYPNDSRIPEALHRVVVTTRFTNFKDEETSNFSKKAYDLLHKNYPKGSWTEKTPYHY